MRFRVSSSAPGTARPHVSTPRPSPRPARRSGRRGTVTAAIAAASVLLAVSASTGASASTAPLDRWATSSGNAGNAEVNAGESVLTAATAPQVALRWKLGVEAEVQQLAPVVVNGVAYMTTSWAPSTPSSLLALNLKTGATLWRLPIPADAHPEYGMAVTGDRLLIGYRWGGATYMHQASPGGVIAIDLLTRRIVWRSALPSQNGSSGPAGQPYSDGKQVYVTGAENAVVAFRLSDGKLLWHVAAPWNPRENPPADDGMAVSGGRVFVVDGDGLVAFDGLTGKRLWSSSTAISSPIVANGVVFTKTIFGMEAFSAAGCGRSTCDPIWFTKIAHLPTQDTVQLWSADSSSLYVSYGTFIPNSTACYNGTGYIARLDPRTGKLLWTVASGGYINDVVHAGNLLWVLHTVPAGPCDYPDQRIVAYTANTTTAPKLLVQIPLPENQPTGQQLAVAAGTVLYKAGLEMRGARIRGQ